jgi:hypothetical protein
MVTQIVRYGLDVLSRSANDQLIYVGDNEIRKSIS